MKKKIAASVLLLLAAVLFSINGGCKKDDNPVGGNGSSVNSIMPLIVGNSWTFIDSSFTDNGVFERADTSRLAITGKTNISYQDTNIEVYYWDWVDESNGQSTGIKFLCGNDDNGFNFYGGEYLDSMMVLGQYLFLRYPVEPGEQWDWIKISYQGDSLFIIEDTNKVTCISVNEQFKTAQGTFNCYVYYYRRTYFNRMEENYLFFAENIGYVGAITKVNGIVTYKKLLLSNNLLKYGINTKAALPSGNKQYSIFGVK